MKRKKKMKKERMLCKYVIGNLSELNEKKKVNKETIV